RVTTAAALWVRARITRTPGKTAMCTAATTAATGVNGRTVAGITFRNQIELHPSVTKPAIRQAQSKWTDRPLTGFRRIQPNALKERSGQKITAATRAEEEAMPVATAEVASPAEDPAVVVSEVAAAGADLTRAARPRRIFSALRR